jgi:hypothetical protein
MLIDCFLTVPKTDIYTLLRGFYGCQFSGRWQVFLGFKIIIINTLLMLLILSKHNIINIRIIYIKIFKYIYIVYSNE